MKLVFALLSLFLSLSAYAQGPSSLTVTGMVNQTLVVSARDLAALPVKTGGPIAIVSSSGQVRKTLGTYRGALLRDLIERAGMKLDNQKEKGRYFIVARATDGYTVILAHNELFNNPTGQQTYVLYEENGQPIGADGPFVLLVANDLVTGARHVKWLASLTVQKLP